MLTEDLGIAVSRQAHDFRSVVVREAKITGEQLPQEADRMRILERLDGLDTRTDGFRKRGAGRLAHSVDGEDGRAIEARREICRSRMCQMVRHEMQSLSQRTSKNFFD